MRWAGMQLVRLAPHAETRQDAVRQVDARVRRGGDGTLALTFGLAGDLSRLRIPRAGERRRGRDLWRHTCFEVFVARDGDTAYHEFNVSPSCEWAVYAFRSYRDGGPLDDDRMAPSIVVRREGGRLELDALVALDRLSSSHRHDALRLALSAVLEADDGMLSYWALHHPPGSPDFHHAEGFVLRLEGPAAFC